MHNNTFCQLIFLVVTVSYIVTIIPAIARYIDYDYDNFDDQFNGTESKSTSQDSRIAGGYPAREGEFPSFVGLKLFRYDENLAAICGGVAISDRLILTAAHCSIKRGKENYNILVAPGIWHPNKWKAKGVETYKVAKKCISRKYQDQQSPPSYDYQILQLERPIPDIEPAFLQDTYVPLGYRAITVGNGILDNYYRPEGVFPVSLQALPVERVNCPKIHQHPTRICFRSHEREYVGDSCAGDSGGPIYGRRGDGRVTVVGLTSYGPEMCREGTNGISGNADVYNGRQEINKLIRECSEDMHRTARY